MQRNPRGAAGKDNAGAVLAQNVSAVPAAAFIDLVESLTNVITVAVNTAMASSSSAPVVTKETKISTSINLYDKESMNLSPKEGNHH